MENFISKNMKNDAHFVVSLDGLKLSEEQIARIDKGIKNIVLKEIASIDTKGDYAINSRLEENPKFFQFKVPELFGIWIETFSRRIERMDFINRL